MDIYQKIVDNNAGLLNEDEEATVADVFLEHGRRATSELTEGTFRMDVGAGWLFFSGFEVIQPMLARLYEEDLLQQVESDDWGTSSPIRIVMGQRTGSYTRDILTDLVKGQVAGYTDDTVDLLETLVREDLIEFRTVSNRNFHPKIFNFYYHGPSPDDTWVGSANFSSGGLGKNIELCVPTHTTPKTRERFRSWFDALWSSANPDIDVLEVVESVRRTHGIYQSPSVFFARAIKSLNRQYLLEDTPGSEGDLLLNFQTLTYTLVMNRLELYGGYILANSVGTGKTYVSAQTAATYLNLNPDSEILVVAPSNESIQENWHNILRKFGIEDKVVMESIGEFQKTNWEDADGESRSRIFDEREYADRFSLIVADEAHRFRNDSNRRQNLDAVIKKNRRARILLMTATPINLSPKDLFQLVDLFRSGRRVELFQQRDLNDLYETAKRKFFSLVDYNDFNDELLDEIREIEQELFIKISWRIIQREFQSDLRELAGEVVTYEEPVVEEVNYTYPTPVNRTLFEEIVPFLEQLNYEPAKIRIETGYQKNLDLIFLQKWRLYKRLESSLSAFYVSIQNLYRRTEYYYTVLKSQMALESADLTDFVDATGVIEDPLNAELPDAITPTATNREEQLVAAFERLDDDLQSDIIHRMADDVETCERMLDRVERVVSPEEVGRYESDTKIEYLLEIIEKAFDRDAPILVFSEHIPTVEYIYNVLTREYVDRADRIAIIHGEMDTSKRELILRVNEGEIDIVVSSAVLEEGVNLPAIDWIVNYDLPYNPTRLIQRAGRALRITNPKQIRIFNFAPDDAIDKELELYDRLDARLQSILEIAGLDFVVWMMDDKDVASLHEDEREEYFAHLQEYKKHLGRENPESIVESGPVPEQSRTDQILKKAIYRFNVDRELLDAVSEFRRDGSVVYTNLRTDESSDEGDRAERAAIGVEDMPNNLAVFGMTGEQHSVWVPLKESVKPAPSAHSRDTGLTSRDFSYIERLEEMKAEELLREQTAAGSLGLNRSSIVDLIREVRGLLDAEEHLNVVDSLQRSVEQDAFTPAEMTDIRANCEILLNEGYDWVQDPGSIIIETSEWDRLTELADAASTTPTWKRNQPGATGIIKYSSGKASELDSSGR
jgi:superfamily II DNA or RNA helicase